MKLLSYLSACIVAILHAVTSFFTMTIPSAGEATFKAVDMANQGVGKAYEEMLIENYHEIKAMYEDAGLEPEEIEAIKAQANAYKNNVVLQESKLSKRADAHANTKANQASQASQQASY